jgi:ankyrin repeat protein
MNSRLWISTIITLAAFAATVLAQDGSAFIAAVTGGEVSRVKEMLARNSKLVRAVDKDGASAILKAIYYGRKEVLDVLLATGVELDVFEASALGRTDRVMSLIAKEPSLVNALAPDGFYPLGLAVFFKHPDTAEALVKAGADVNASARNKLKVAPLHAAAAAQQLGLARLLIERGADVNARQQEDFTPLHEVAITGQIEFASLLLDRGADINVRSAKGKTALTYALEAGKEEMVKLLQSRGGMK